MGSVLSSRIGQKVVSKTMPDCQEDDIVTIKKLYGFVQGRNQEVWYDLVDRYRWLEREIERIVPEGEHQGRAIYDLTMSALRSARAFREAAKG